MVQPSLTLSFQIPFNLYLQLPAVPRTSQKRKASPSAAAANAKRAAGNQRTVTEHFSMAAELPGLLPPPSRGGPAQRAERIQQARADLAAERGGLTQGAALRHWMAVADLTPSILEVLLASSLLHSAWHRLPVASRVSAVNRAVVHASSA